ncbi:MULTISPECIES: DUF4157 domain-containing protein [unclassified Nonomuraea]|uniref:eCIS core domain-containing protein n=1 Tax=unclassified Nonomuraea TaxID=2593643 RepID=UPI0033D68E70
MFTYVTRVGRCTDGPEPIDEKCGCSSGFDVRRYADGGLLAAPEKWTVSKPYDADEVAADLAAERVMAGQNGQRANDLAGFGRAFGHDFAGVRLHTDGAAAGFARTMHAQAVTVGRQIFFREGAYQPHTPKGRRLLAHELAHVVQNDRDHQPRVRRYHCPTQDPPSINPMTGIAVHQAIQKLFALTVKGALSIGIPGASDRPRRTEGLCGAPKTVIPPQPLGGRAGMGFPDLAVIRNRVLSIAEIKPASKACLVDGEFQLSNYLEQATAMDDKQVAWRKGIGVDVVSGIDASIFPGRVILAGPVAIWFDWCLPGLLGYHLYRLLPLPMTVTQDARDKERENLRQEARRRRLVIAGAAAAGVTAAVRVIAGKAVWRHFWAVVIKRFAVRAAAAAALALADGPLPFGELLDLGLAVVTVAQIAIEWNDLWRQADELAAQEGA